jgi:hypothetical protein
MHRGLLAAIATMVDRYVTVTRAERFGNSAHSRRSIQCQGWQSIDLLPFVDRRMPLMSILTEAIEFWPF